MRIDGREVALEITASPAHDPQFGIRVTGVESEAAEVIRRRVASLVAARGSAWPRSADVLTNSSRTAEDTKAIRVGVVGPADPERMRELGQEVWQIVAEEVGGSRAARATCVCYGNLPAEEVRIKPEEILWFDSNGMWKPPPAPGADWLIAVFLDKNGWNAAALHVWDGATNSPPVPKNQVLVGLANGTSWPKEIWADNLCSGRVSSVYQETTNPSYRRILIDSPDCYDGADTIVFRKPGLFGIWHEVSHFEPNDFWRAFGGTRCDFHWVKDY
jgi:hypothetical protein